jgi:Nitrate and nitrite sensing/Histidine kinase-, DNA gyrase B-, and HSP90-like ATPase
MTISTQRGPGVPGPPLRRRRGPRLFRLRDWRVRTKLGAVLTIPAVAFLAIAAIQTNASIRQAESLQQFTRQVHLSRQVTALVHELQRERDRTAGVLAGVAAHPNPVDQDPGHIAQELRPDQAAVDEAATALRNAARPLLADRGVRQLYDRANASVQALDQVRAGVQAGWLRQAAVFDSYTKTINNLLELLPAESQVGSGGEALGRSVRGLDTLALSKELTDQVRGRLYALIISGQVDAQQFQILSDLRAQRQTVLDQFRNSANSNELAAYDGVVHGPAVSAAERMVQKAVDDARTGKVSLDPNQWWQATSTGLDQIREVEKQLLAAAVADADHRNAGQWRGTLTATAIIIVILIIALFTSWRIGRSMAHSLRLLREQALDVAARRLPEAIERLRASPNVDPALDMTGTAVDTADEVGEVAKAFTAVHRSAMRLALEQAMMRRAVNAMFVNLARRSQTLVERQLQLLDNLESAETDPDQLANLFRLDHLATRMRRNDENLLVLAGADSSRRWSEPVALSAVVLAAMAEIEQYPRIRHDVSEDVHVVGHAVADVVHLLAELLENATTFSPPDSPVTVTGWRAEDGAGATILIEDRGIGMSESSLAEANQQLTRATSIDVATSERMGLLVVANLSDRHRIKVELAPADQGVRARVLLPAQLLAPPPLHRAAGLFGARSVPAGQAVAELAAGAQPAVAGADRPAIAAGVGPQPAPAQPAAGQPAVRPAVQPASQQASQPAASAGPVLRVVGMPTPAAGVPVITVVGNAASLRRPVARVVGGPSGVETRPVAAQVGTPVAASVKWRADGDQNSTAVPAGAARSPIQPPVQPPVQLPTRPPAQPVQPPVQPRIPAGFAASAGPSLPPGTPVNRSIGGDGAPRRATPTRAEDVLSAVSTSMPEASRWWSRTAPASPSRPPAPAPREPVDAGTSDAGLPIRVPMAQLPGDGTVPTQRPVDQPAKIAHEPDPSQVSSMLSAFYSGVHRAAAEELGLDLRSAQTSQAER